MPGTMPRRFLLACGVLASIVYLGADVLAGIFFGEYHSFTSRVISELMARGAPTERLVDPLFLLYGALTMAFGSGVWMSSPRTRASRWPRPKPGSTCAWNRRPFASMSW